MATLRMDCPATYIKRLIAISELSVLSQFASPSLVPAAILCSVLSWGILHTVA